MRFRDGSDSECESPKKARQVKRKVTGMIFIFFDINGIAHKEIVVAGQRVNYYCKVFGVTALILAKIWARTFGTKELTVAS
jgi:hypothetical protein